MSTFLTLSCPYSFTVNITYYSLFMNQVPEKGLWFITKSHCRLFDYIISTQNHMTAFQYSKSHDCRIKIKIKCYLNTLLTILETFSSTPISANFATIFPCLRRNRLAVFCCLCCLFL